MQKARGLQDRYGWLREKEIPHKATERITLIHSLTGTMDDDEIEFD